MKTIIELEGAMRAMERDGSLKALVMTVGVKEEKKLWETIENLTRTNFNSVRAYGIKVIVPGYYCFRVEMHFLIVFSYKGLRSRVYFRPSSGEYPKIHSIRFSAGGKTSEFRFDQPKSVVEVFEYMLEVEVDGLKEMVRSGGDRKLLMQKRA